MSKVVFNSFCSSSISKKSKVSTSKKNSTVNSYSWNEAVNRKTENSQNATPKQKLPKTQNSPLHLSVENENLEEGMQVSTENTGSPLITKKSLQKKNNSTPTKKTNPTNTISYQDPDSETSSLQSIYLQKNNHSPSYPSKQTNNFQTSTLNQSQPQTLVVRLQNNQYPKNSTTHPIHSTQATPIKRAELQKVGAEVEIDAPEAEYSSPFELLASKKKTSLNSFSEMEKAKMASKRVKNESFALAGDAIQSPVQLVQFNAIETVLATTENQGLSSMISTNALDSIEEMIQNMADEISVLTVDGTNETSISLTNSGVFNEAVVTVVEYDTAPNEINIQFTNLNHKAQELISKPQNQEFLRAALDSKGIQVHLITAVSQLNEVEMKYESQTFQEQFNSREERGSSSDSGSSFSGQKKRQNQ